MGIDAQRMTTVAVTLGGLNVNDHLADEMPPPSAIGGHVRPRRAKLGRRGRVDPVLGNTVERLVTAPAG